MKTLYLLMVLSQNGAGDINASFVNSANQEDCLTAQAMVQGIFISNSIPLLYSNCFPSTLKFTPFEHSNSTSARRFHYLIRLGNEEILIDPVEDWQACVKSAQKTGEWTAYCASSTQRRLSDGR